jgi:hypothetical protein
MQVLYLTLSSVNLGQWIADDCIANKKFRPTYIHNEADAIQELEKYGMIINHWMNSNKLKMNTSKTEFIIFGSSKQLDRCSTKRTCISIDGDEIEFEHCIRCLSVYLDKTLHFKEENRRKCRTAIANYLRIKSIRKYLTKEAT